MKKIMFNKRYMLEASVIDGDKNQTRRIESGFRYGIGEVIAIAQPYQELLCCTKSDRNRAKLYSFMGTAGWNNKMFVKPELMNHFIKITARRKEMLQDISDSDCLAEGIEYDDYTKKYCFFDLERSKWHEYDTPREAFANLIDRVSGKGTWESNPEVAAYEFELLK